MSDDKARGTPLILKLFVFVALLSGLVLIWGLRITGGRHLLVDLIASYFLLWGLISVSFTASRRELYARFTLTTVSLGLIMGLVETSALSRVVDFERLLATEDTDEWIKPGNNFDPDLLWVRRPNLTFSLTPSKGNIASAYCLPVTGSKQRYELRYDRNGFRNDPGNNSAAIAVIGDSYVEGVDLAKEDIFTSLLAKRTGATVANLGLSGYGPQQELLVLERYAIPLAPKTILWCFFEGNDLEDIYQYEFIRRRIDKYGKIPRSAGDRSFLRNAMRWMIELYRKKTCAVSPTHQSLYGTYSESDKKRTPMYFFQRDELPKRREERMLERLESIFARAHKVTRSAGIDLVVVYIPTKFRVYRGLLDFPEGSACLDWTVSNLPQRLDSLLRRTSPEIRFVDLTPAFVSRASEGGEPLYFLYDTHWTRAGHLLAAETIHAFLSAVPRRRSFAMGPVR